MSEQDAWKELIPAQLVPSRVVYICGRDGRFPGRRWKPTPAGAFPISPLDRAAKWDGRELLTAYQISGTYAGMLGLPTVLCNAIFAVCIMAGRGVAVFERATVLLGDLW